MGEVLQRFNLQIHHLKMVGYALSVNTFARYYETHLHKKVVKNKRTKVEMVAHYGSYNFVPRKAKGTM